MIVKVHSQIFSTVVSVAKNSVKLNYSRETFGVESFIRLKMIATEGSSAVCIKIYTLPVFFV
jgi:hypothetical protein